MTNYWESSSGEKYPLSDTCVCGKPTENNKFWTCDDEDRQHQLCRDCTQFTIKGVLADRGYKNIKFIDDRNKQ